MSAAPHKPVGGDAIYRLPLRPVVAGSSHRESPIKGRLCDTLLTFSSPDQMTTAPARRMHIGR